MERDVMTKLVEWKNSTDRKPLILKGARQVGKTYILKEFGKRYFENVIYINCDNDYTAQEILTKDYDIDRILNDLSIYTKSKITKDSTLLIFDEIQEAPKGLHLLKYFCENAPEYHIAVAGSLLGISLHAGESFPVGKVDMIEMYPMSFIEFLNACGESGLAEMVVAHNYESVNVFLPKLSNLLRQYYFVGGMPKIVDSFIKTKDASKVREMQLAILSAYQNDISKHAPNNVVPRINQVWQSIPSQLAKENKKFVYGAIRKGARAAEFEVAIQWLVDAGLIYKVNRVAKVAMPLNFYVDSPSFKLFVLDCGLMGAMSHAPAEMMLISDNVFVEFKGAFTEQYVAQQLICMLSDTPVCYYTNEKSTQEIDFVIQRGSEIVPIEVKAEENVKAKAFKVFLAEHPDLHGIRTSMLPYRVEDHFTNIPLAAIAGFRP